MWIARPRSCAIRTAKDRCCSESRIRRRLGLQVTRIVSSCGHGVRATAEREHKSVWSLCSVPPWSGRTPARTPRAPRSPAPAQRAMRISIVARLNGESSLPSLSYYTADAAREVPRSLSASSGLARVMAASRVRSARSSTVGSRCSDPNGQGRMARVERSRTRGWEDSTNVRPERGGGSTKAAAVASSSRRPRPFGAES